MCGLAAVVFPRRPAQAEARVRRMLAAQRHRGPDGQGLFSEPAAALGHVRLALLDVAGGQQPMIDSSGRYVLIYNGEIYNHERLRRRLSYPFRTRSDAETLLAALLAWGEDAIDQLDGMFAFFLWDRQRRRGLGARDALGVKPLVYSYGGGELALASELKALLSQGPPVRLRQGAVVEYLLAPGLSGVREPLCEGCAYLPAGWRLTIDEAGLSAGPWLQEPFPAPRGTYLPDEETPPLLQAALRAAARDTLVADVPVGLFLSGGLDSTALGALMAEAQAGTTALTISFTDQARYDYGRSRIVVSDDTPYALEAARCLGLRHRLVPAPREALMADLPELVASADRLPAWEQEFAQRHLARAAREAGLKAVLVGDCADETHYGYFFLLSDAVTAAPGGILSLFAPSVRLACLRPELREGRPLEGLGEAYGALCAAAGHGHEDRERRLLATTHLIVQLWLGRLLVNGDLHSMASSIEARVPFAARPLLRLARRVRPGFAFQDGEEKHALRRALAPLLPAAVASRRKSALPKDQGLGPHYQRALASLLAQREEAAFLCEWLDLGALHTLCEKPALCEDERALLFNVLGLAYWRRRYL